MKQFRATVYSHLLQNPKLLQEKKFNLVNFLKDLSIIS